MHFQAGRPKGRCRHSDDHCQPGIPQRFVQSLLTGILFCGRCGRRMTVFYHGRRNVLRYQCTTGIVDFRASRCQSLSGQVLDELIAKRVLAALEPASLELSLMAADDLESQRRRFDDNWRQRLERTHFDADRAKRQYQAVEPENRLVAHELERQWEALLQDVQTLEQDYAGFARHILQHSRVNNGG